MNSEWPSAARDWTQALCQVRLMQPNRRESLADPADVERGLRRTRFAIISYAIAIVSAFCPGGAIIAADPWGGGWGHAILPIAFIVLGLGFSVGAIRRGKSSVGIWSLVMGLTVAPFLAWLALLLGVDVFWVS